MDILKGSWSKQEQKKKLLSHEAEKKDKYLNILGTLYKTSTIFKTSIQLGK